MAGSGGKSIVSATDGKTDSVRITCTVGSKAGIRAMGAFLAPKSWIPLRITVYVESNEGERQVMVKAEDDFGFGSLIGVKDRFINRCNEFQHRFTEDLKLKLL